MSKFASLLCFAGFVGGVIGQSNSVLQSPDVFELLSQNKPVMTADKMADLLRNVVPGKTFPMLAEIPSTSFSCNDAGQGYFADVETDCQVFRYCSHDLVRTMFFLLLNKLTAPVTLTL